MTAPRMVFVLGRRQEPADGVADFCAQLGAALERRGVPVETFTVPWQERGRRGGLRALAEAAGAWKGNWALLQYTPLAWSRRGFPVLFGQAARLLRRAGVRLGVVLHDPWSSDGARWRDRVRGRVQLSVLRGVVQMADRTVCTIDPQCVPWMRRSGLEKTVTPIPAGSNLPVRWTPPPPLAGRRPRVAVFCMSLHGLFQSAEAKTIAATVLSAARRVGGLRLVVFGRGAREAGPSLQAALAAGDVELECHGVLPGEEAARLLEGADVQLFIRGGVSARRGTAVAAICAGVPVVGYSSAETAFPVTQAGVRLAPGGDTVALAAELAAVLSDAGLRGALRERNRAAAEKFFSWEAIAESYCKVVNG